MPITTCPNCSHEITEGSETCANCEKPVHYPEPVGGPGGSKKATLALWVVFTVAFLAIWQLLAPGKESGALLIRLTGEDGTTIRNANVWMDGVLVCFSTPCRVADAGAEQTVIKVDAPGYRQPKDRVVTPIAGGKTLIECQLLKQ